MAARSVRCLFSNQTSSALTYVSDNHDHGQFTDPWYPPATIAPGAMAEWRSESDGFMTGTEGTVRYSTGVMDSSGSGHTEFIDVHWDNPFVGGNEASMSAVADFTNAPSTVLKTAWFIESNGEVPPNWAKAMNGDVEAWIDGILFPPYFLANWNTSSFNDANAFFAVKEGTIPQFIGDFGGPPTGTKSTKLNKSNQPAEWAGHWSFASVSVTLISKGGKAMTAYVTDNASNPPLQYQQDFTLGSPSWVAEHMVTSVIQSHAGGSNELAGALRSAASTTAIALHGDEGISATKTFAEKAQSLAKVRGIPINASRLEVISKSVGSYVASTRYTVALMNGVYLTLYDEFTGKQKTGAYLRYERHGALGVVQHTEDLRYIVDLH